jgi:hypothetical protein
MDNAATEPTKSGSANLARWARFYEATHVATGREAAVKLLRREPLGDPRHVERFLREVRIASSIDSPHVVKVLEASTPLDPLPFLANGAHARPEARGDLGRAGVVGRDADRALGRLKMCRTKAGTVSEDVEVDVDLDGRP